MRQQGAQQTDCERGQASVEFLGSLPAALLVVLLSWQLVLAGQARWLAGNAARVGARAEAVGGDPAIAARRALPSYLRRRLEVAAADSDGRVRVRVNVPFVLRHWSLPLEIGGSAAMERQVR
jgi:hypothetical protein